MSEKRAIFIKNKYTNSWNNGCCENGWEYEILTTNGDPYDDKLRIWDDVLED